MIEDLVFSFNAVLPLFLIIALGWVVKILGFWDDAIIKKINKISFNFAMPFLLFRDIIKSDLTQVFDPRLVIYAVLITFILFFLLWIMADRFIKNKPSVGAFVQGCFRGNYAIIGLSVVNSVMGSSSPKAALIITFVVPIYNILSVVVLSMTSGIQGTKVVKTAVINVLKNPLIIGIIAGIPFSVFHIKLPSALNGGVNYLAQLSTPLALLCIGGSIDFKQMKNNLPLAVLASFIKLIAVPVVFLFIAYFIGIQDGEDLLILFVMLASPAAINSYVMASNMGSDDKLAAGIVLISTIASVVTFTMGIFIFRILGMI